MKNQCYLLPDQQPETSGDSNQVQNQGQAQQELQPELEIEIIYNQHQSCFKVLDSSSYSSIFVKFCIIFMFSIFFSVVLYRYYFDIEYNEIKPNNYEKFNQKKITLQLNQKLPLINSNKKTQVQDNLPMTQTKKQDKKLIQLEKLSKKNSKENLLNQRISQISGLNNKEKNENIKEKNVIQAHDFKFKHQKITPQKQAIMKKVNDLLAKQKNPQEQSQIQKIKNKALAQVAISTKQIINAKKLISIKDIEGQQKQKLQNLQKTYYEQKYKLSQYAGVELPICVVIPSYNNIPENRYKSNILSIIQQQYTNYHIVFIDDASTDQTYDQTFKILSKMNFPPERLKMVRNQQQNFAMPNLRNAAMNFCKPEQIFIIVDGDDQLIGRQVFRLYNVLFQKTGAYFIYSNFIINEKLSAVVGYSHPFQNDVKLTNSYRKRRFITSHLRAFYTKLFQLIKQEDLKDNKGNYFKAANDVAICLPILQMSGERVQYFPQLTYNYHATNLSNTMLRFFQQRQNQKQVRKKTPYKRIQNLFS